MSIRIEQHTKLVALDAWTRAKLQRMQVTCEWCNIPIAWSKDTHHTITKIMTREDEEVLATHYFFCCSSKCYKKEDKKLESVLIENSGEHFVGIIEEWGEDE